MSILPPGAPADLYASLIRMAHLYRCRVLLDTSGEALRQGLQAAPDFVKPNRSEAASFADCPVPDAQAAADPPQQHRDRQRLAAEHEQGGNRANVEGGHEERGHRRVPHPGR